MNWTQAEINLIELNIRLEVNALIVKFREAGFVRSGSSISKKRRAVANQKIKK